MRLTEQPDRQSEIWRTKRKLYSRSRSLLPVLNAKGRPKPIVSLIQTMSGAAGTGVTSTLVIRLIYVHELRFLYKPNSNLARLHKLRLPCSISQYVNAYQVP